MKKLVVMGLVMGWLGAGCAEVQEPIARVDTGPYQAGWIPTVLGQADNLDACLGQFPSPAAVFHASKLDDGVLGVMVIDGMDRAHACTVLDGQVLEKVDMEDVTLADLRGTPRYQPGPEEPEAETSRAYRSESGEVVGWVYWP